jgi:hypothetical protein
MKTRTTIHWFAGLAGALLLALPVMGWAASDWRPGGVPGALARCEADLEACLAEPCAIFPGDGWPEDAPDYAIPGGAPLNYAGPGEIGEDDPPEGTFIDLNTGLMWEIKDSADGVADYTNPHDVDNLYTWSEATASPYIPNGSAFELFLAELNAEPGFAGYTDWRLPTVKELQSLVDYSVPYPGTTVAEGLPGATASSYYWSSTAYASFEPGAWGVSFGDGYVNGIVKDFDGHVRAVRGGW